VFFEFFPARRASLRSAVVALDFSFHPTEAHRGVVLAAGYPVLSRGGLAVPDPDPVRCLTHGAADMFSATGLVLTVGLVIKFSQFLIMLFTVNY
jgi:hypothetical protein